MPEQRPNPEKLLQKIKEEEQKQRRGKLKIYLGAAPGVGKTHEMLHDALKMREKGLDVVIGVVVSHGRQDIESLLKNFEILSKQVIDYHGKELLEFDLDSALKRHPGLILMDEMAHTNAPGLRHTKRWQDIKELLDRGIDVYTTLNVQHIESLNNKVSQIIHAPVKETVPDSMIEMADTLELVDIPPEELLKRLHEGKVYLPDQAELAAEKFFRKGNLIALRELALRVTAESVDAQLLIYRQSEGIKHIWSTKEKILVCVGPGAESLNLIRTARRLVASFKAKWIAIYVDSPHSQLSAKQRNSAIQNLRLAEQLGAETKILTGIDIVKEVMTFAREHNITLIMVWKHIRSRWKDIFFRRLADEILRYSGEIDVYIMTGKLNETKPKQLASTRSPVKWKTYIIALSIVALATAFNFLLYPLLSASNLIMVYLVGVTLVALYGEIVPSIIASVVSVLAYDFFFIPPFYSLDVAHIEYFFTLVVMLLVTQIISYLTILTRRQANAAQFAEHQMRISHALSRQLASARGVDKLLEIGVQYISKVFDTEILAFLPENHRLKIRARSKTKHEPDDKELSVAHWVYDLGQIAGAGTDTLTFSKALFIPLLASQGTMGVLQIYSVNPEILFTPEQINLLGACANQIALAIEVDQLQEQAKKYELQTEVDRTQNKLLQFISHELRDPLDSIMISSRTQIQLFNELKPTEIKQLGTKIYSESEQLSRLINNLLQVSYLESEEMTLDKQLCSLSDIINLAINTSRLKPGNRSIELHIPEDLPKVPMDSALMKEVFANLIDNAIKLTPPTSSIEISAFQDNNEIIVTVTDHGPGIVADEVNKLFEKFYRGRMLTTEKGLGLGLAICKRIIEAHGGKIWAENRKEGGADFRFTLMLHE